MIHAYIGGFDTLADFDHQKSAIAEFAVTHGLEIGEWWVEIVDFSTATNRKLLELSRQATPNDLLLVEGVSRLGHSLQSVLSILRHLCARGITLKTVAEELVFSGSELAEAYQLALQVDMHLLRELRHFLPRKRPQHRRRGRSILDGREVVVRAFLKRDLSRATMAKILDVSTATVNHFVRTRQKEIGLHYLHMEKEIRAYFRQQAIRVEIEPSGSSGPDLVVVGSNVVGEIKHREEIGRDICGYYAQWNSTLSFGGKTSEYRLRDDLPPGVDELPREVQGWITVMYGQLRFYCRRAGSTTGWLVLEDVEPDDQHLNGASEYLQTAGKIIALETGQVKNVLFLCLRFPELGTAVESTWSPPS